MADLVEGEWKEFVFKFVTPKDHSLIFEFLKEHWYPDEIMSNYAGVDEDFIHDFEGFCQLAFAEDISFIAWHKETGEIAGLRFTFTSRKTDDWSLHEFRSKAAKNVVKVISILEAKANLYEKFEIDYLANFFVASVSRKFRRQGLATEMYRRSINLLKRKGYPLCKSTFSSPYTRKAATNLGFEEMARIYLQDMHDDNGGMDFKGCTPEDFASIMCLKL